MIDIDTNVFIYSIDRNDLVKRAKARSLLRQLRLQSENVTIPWQVLAEFLRFLRSLQDQKRIQRGELERIFNAYRRLFPVALPTPFVFDQALSLTSRYSLSHWDSMLLGACLEVKAETLYTEDMEAPTMIDGISLINPFA
jgi:predicted nucleic acid-binding protein